MLQKLELVRFIVLNSRLWLLISGHMSSLMVFIINHGYCQITQKFDFLCFSSLESIECWIIQCWQHLEKSVNWNFLKFFFFRQDLESGIYCTDAGTLGRCTKMLEVVQLWVGEHKMCVYFCSGQFSLQIFTVCCHGQWTGACLWDFEVGRRSELRIQEKSEYRAGQCQTQSINKSQNLEYSTDQLFSLQ